MSITHDHRQRKTISLQNVSLEQNGDDQMGGQGNEGRSTEN